MSQEEYDERKSELLKAEADVRNAVAGIASAKAAVISAKAAEASAQAAVAIAELNLDYTTVTAPLSGRVSRNMVSAGNLIQAGQSGGGTLLTTIVSVDPIYAYFDVDEHTVQHVQQLIRQGSAESARDVEITNLAWTRQRRGIPTPRHDQLHRQSGSSQYGHSASAGRLCQSRRSARARVLRSDPRTNRQFAQGATRLRTRTGNGPGAEGGLRRGQGQPGRLPPRSTGCVHDGRREISDGLKPGERVIVNGLQLVRPGVTVAPNLVDMPASKDPKANEAASRSNVARNP